MILYLNEAGSVLKKKGGRYVVEADDGSVREIPSEKLEAVVIFSGTHVTTPCLISLIEKGVAITFLSSTGKYFGRAESTAHFNIERHRTQFRVSEDPSFCLNLARAFVKGKIHNNLVVLRRYNRRLDMAAVDDCIRRIHATLANLDRATTLSELNGMEGYASRLYFQSLSIMVRPEFRFSGRNRQPPRDPFNSLLSFGYTLLMYEVYTAIVSKGLHPYLGFLHQVRRGHPALASDLMEEWRPILVDSLVMYLVQGRTLTLDDFTISSEDRGVYLRKEQARVFIAKFQQRLNVEQKYLADDRSCTFREAIQNQVGLLVSCIERNSPESYQPIMLR